MVSAWPSPVVPPSTPARLIFISVTRKVAHDVVEVAGEPRPFAIGRDLEDLGAPAAVEKERVGAVLSLDGVLPSRGSHWNTSSAPSSTLEIGRALRGATISIVQHCLIDLP